MSVDHIIPVGSLKSYDDIVPFIQRLFVAEDKLQVLCKTDHNVKTQEERRRGRERQDSDAEEAVE